MKHLFWDTETERFRPGLMAPPLVCISFKDDEGRDGLLNWWQCQDWITKHLQDRDTCLVGHNIFYDLAVIAAQFPDTLDLIFDAFDGNRIKDTMIRAKLLDIAMGCFRGQEVPIKNKDGSDSGKTRWVSWSYSLDDCFYRATRKRLDKDTWRTRYGELREIPIDTWPIGAQAYTVDDAKATETVYAWQERVVISAEERLFMKLDLRTNIFQDQFSQTRAGWWMHLMKTWGIRTDSRRVNILREYVEHELEAIRGDLQRTGLVRLDGSRDTKKAAERMVFVMGGEEHCRKTETGNIQLDEAACKESHDPVLAKYADLTSLQNVLNKDIKALSDGERHPIHSNFDSLIATGRSSSSAPNIQNIRRLPGIRECFVPRNGRVFLDADYDGLELRTLAQVCMTLFGESRLAEILNAGRDPHLEFAIELLPGRITYEEAAKNKKDPDIDNARQTGKVANFGFPGGLGPAKLCLYAKKTYNVDLTEDRARELKAMWLQKLPEMKKYFNHINQLQKQHPGEPDEQKPTVEHLFSRRVRSEISYSVACNSYFQGLGADATKSAGYLIAKECYQVKESPLYGCRIVNYIHDQFLLECPEYKCHEAAMRLARAMEEGAAPYLPDVPPKVSEPLVARFWSKNAKPMFSNGRLVPWEKEFEVKKRTA